MTIPQRPQMEDRHRLIVEQILGPLLPATWVFGSRAKHVARPFSDLDLLIKADIARDQLANLKQKFEDSELPFKVDVLLENSAESEFLRQIEKDLIQF